MGPRRGSEDGWTGLCLETVFGTWYPGTVRYILDNPKYRGQIEYFLRWEEDKTRVIQEGEHAAIVEE